MSALPDDPANYCYRHPNRQSFVLCQRCGRTICPECQTQAAVGVHCPECVRESRQSMPTTRPAVITAVRRATRTDAPVVTYGIIAICLLVFIAEAATGLLTRGTSPVYFYLAYQPQFTTLQPWTLVTALFDHASIPHVLLNMLSLFVIGRQIEPMIGRIRYLALFLLAGIAGNVGVLLVAPNVAVVGASGAIFGLFGAYFIIARHLGANATQILVVIALNLGLGFIIPGIAWQAHVGGLLVGALVAFIFVRTRARRQRFAQVLLTSGVLVGLLVLTIVGTTLLSVRAG